VIRGVSVPPRLTAIKFWMVTRFRRAIGSRLPGLPGQRQSGSVVFFVPRERRDARATR